jgi:hypothetical protein
MSNTEEQYFLNKAKEIGKKRADAVGQRLDRRGLTIVKD